MAQTEIALYQEEELCVHNLKNTNGEYNEEKRALWKERSQKDQLHCPDCNGLLTLRVGPKNEPHFAHREKSSCDDKQTVHEYTLKERGILYRIAAQNIGQHIETVKLLKKYKKEKYGCDLELKSKTDTIVWDYISSSRTLPKITDLIKYYKEKGIRYIAFLNKNLLEEKITTLEYYLLMNQKVIYIIDENDPKTITGKLYTMNGVYEKDSKEEKLPVDNCEINPDGTIKFRGLEKLIQLRDRKEQGLQPLQPEENISKNSNEKDTEEFCYEYSEEEKQLLLEDWDSIFEKPIPKKSLHKKKIEETPPVAYQELYRKIGVDKRTVLKSKSEARIPELVYYIPLIKEYWEIPQLEGSYEDYIKGYERRKKNINSFLHSLEEEISIELATKRIEAWKHALDQHKAATWWYCGRE